MHHRDLQPASFRGASFLVPRDTTQEGRNSVVHDYPDQAARYVEDNGALPPCFDITALLHGPTLVSDLKRLRSALTRPGPGVLKHPVFGTHFVMVDQMYSINHTQKNSGVIELDIKFVTTGAPVFPGLVSGIAAVVSQISSSAIQSAFESFLDLYEPPESPYSSMILAENVQTIASELIGHFGQVSGTAKQIFSKAGLFIQDMNLSGDSWQAAYRAPIDDETITNKRLIAGFNAVRLEAQTVIVAANKIESTTADLETRKQALKAVGEFNEFAAFLSMAEAMASREYETGEQVDADELLLSSAFSELQERGLPSEQHDRMYEIHIATSDILDRASVRLPRLVEIDAIDTPASVLAYQLYEKDGLNHADLIDKAQTIVNLNLNKNPSLLGADTKALTRVYNVV